MVLPYYLDRTIAESHVFTATPARLAQLGVKAHLGRRAVSLDPRGGKLTLDDETVLEFDDLLVATGSSPVRPPIPGADGPGVHSFWTLEQARRVVAEVKAGSHVVMVGAGFIAFTILNSILALGARLTIVEIAPQILPRMIDRDGAGLVEAWLRKHGVEIRTGVKLESVEQADGKRRLRFEAGGDLDADVVIMATGIRANLDWLRGSGIPVNRGILVDDHLRSSVPTVYAAGDVAEGRDLVTGHPDVHAIEPTAMEHGRVVGANMAGRAVAYKGSLLMNIVDVCHLDVASFGRWDDPKAEVVSAVRPGRPAYRKLLFHGDRLTGRHDPGAGRRRLDDERRRDAQGPRPDRRRARPLEGAPPPEPVRGQAGLHRDEDDGAAPAGDGAGPAVAAPGPSWRRPAAREP